MPRPVIRMLLRAVVFLGSAAIGLLEAALLIPVVSLSPSGFTLAVVVFAIVQSVLTPLTGRIAARWAPVLVGGVGIVSTLIALATASLLPGGLQISTAAGWLLAALVVWAVTALASLTLSFLLLRDPRSPKRDVGGRRAR
jgi:MFS family permease